ncbi:MAG: hypothetical protein ABI318_12690 [Chthoniobacteraceae bacterium]
MSAARAVWLTCGLLFAAALVACACGLPLMWDGAYQLAVSLVEQKPYFYQTRFHSWLLWWPCVALSRATGSLTALTFAFGLPFIAAPALSLWLSWRVVRKHRPELITWAAFGVAIAGLPGQAFVINDSIWQQTMFWPVFLGALVPVSKRGKLVLGALALFQLSHQAGVLLLLVATLATLAAEMPTPKAIHAQLGKFVPLAMLLLLAVAKAVWVAIPALSGALHDSYAAQRMSWDEICTTFRDGVLGPPLYGLLAMWFAAFSPFAQSRTVRRIGFVAILAAGVLWAWWAAEPARWAGAINYRRWVVPAALPFMFAAFVATRHALQAPVALTGGVTVAKPEMHVAFRFAAPKPRTDFYALAPLVGLVFCVVITLQSLGWRRLVTRLTTEIARDARSVVPRDAVPWVARTPMDHWSMTALVALHEGQQPKKYLAFNAQASATLREGKIWLGDGHSIPASPGPAGWFDHRPLLERLASGER